MKHRNQSIAIRHMVEVRLVLTMGIHPHRRARPRTGVRQRSKKTGREASQQVTDLIWVPDRHRPETQMGVKGESRKLRGNQGDRGYLGARVFPLTVLGANSR